MAKESRTDGIEEPETQGRDRGVETREKEQRETPWKPAPLLPTPNPREGFEFRYVRASMRGEADNINVSQALRDGWELCKASDFEELQIISDRGSQYPENILIGGLLLMMRPSEIGRQQRAYASQESAAQMESVDRNYFREQDPRMPMLRPERRSRVTFGDD